MKLFRKNIHISLAIMLSVVMIFLVAACSVSLAATESSKRQEAKAAGDKASSLYNKVYEAERKVNKLQSDIATKQNAIENTKADIVKTEKEIDEQSESLNKRLAVMYKTGSVGIVDVILSSNNITELITNIGMVQKVLDNDKSVLKELKEKSDKLDKLRKQQEEQEAALEADKKNVQATKDSLKNQADAYKAQEEKLNREADQLAAQAAAAQAAADAKLSAQRQQSGQSPSAASSGGGYLWPIASGGIITSPFGYRVHPIYGYRKFHSGVDIAVGTGTPVRAISDGVVTRASWYGGFGNCVIISIGGGRSTLYGHLSGYAVSNGQYVSKGQTVAYVGSTGASTGPHLHFSLLEYGSYVNPYSIY